MTENYYAKYFLDSYHKERKSQLFLKSEGFKTNYNYLRDLVVSEPFQKTMFKMRRRYKIPPVGFVLEGVGPWNHPPKEWRGSRFTINEIRKELRSLCAEYFLLPRDWYDVLEAFLFYDKIQIALEPNSYNLCFVSDLKTKTDTRGMETTQEDIDAFPITLHISPYASKRSILDYIEKFYMVEIQTLQNRYKNPQAGIGKHRTKGELNRSIGSVVYENRKLPRTELYDLVRKQFPETNIDKAGLGKIISLEMKRREKV
jgi:hypothetical protein